MTDHPAVSLESLTQFSDVVQSIRKGLSEIKGVSTFSQPNAWQEVTAAHASVIASEQLLVFPAGFSASTSYELGDHLRSIVLSLFYPRQPGDEGVSICVYALGRIVYYAALDGSAPSNDDWVRKKRNTVIRFGHSSIGVRFSLALLGKQLGLPETEYAAAGGGFPINVEGVGCIGAVIVSGLKQEEDHAVVVKALAETILKQKNKH